MKNYCWKLNCQIFSGFPLSDTDDIVVSMVSATADSNTSSSMFYTVKDEEWPCAPFQDLSEKFTVEEDGSNSQHNRRNKIIVVVWQEAL